MTKIKVCCISDIEEAQMALRLGADVLGLVSEMPSGPGVIPSHFIKKIITEIPTNTNTFLLTSKQDLDEIVDQYHRLQPHAIQIVDELQEGTLAALKTAIPKAELVQVIHVQDESSIDDALRQSVFADAILLDSGNPNLAIKTLGGTGNTHNWNISKRIVEVLDKPVWLAGGLNALNVSAAIEQVKPYGVDLCSGVRTNGKLDELKLRDFVAAVKA